MRLWRSLCCSFEARLCCRSRPDFDPASEQRTTTTPASSRRAHPSAPRMSTGARAPSSPTASSSRGRYVPPTSPHLPSDPTSPLLSSCSLPPLVRSPTPPGQFKLIKQRWNLSRPDAVFDTLNCWPSDQLPRGANIHYGRWPWARAPCAQPVGSQPSSEESRFCDVKPQSHFKFCAVPWVVPASWKNRTGANRAARKAAREWDEWRKAQDRKAKAVLSGGPKRAAKRAAKRIANREDRKIRKAKRIANGEASPYAGRGAWSYAAPRAPK